MIRIGFFTYPEWAFGAIHRGLEKVLYKHGIYANVFDWNRTYNIEEAKAINKLYDYFVVTPGNPVDYLQKKLFVEPERMIVVAHGRQDISLGIQYHNPFNRFYKFAAVSPDVILYAFNKGIKRGMSVAYNGIHFDYFYNKPSETFKRFGYTGAIRSQIEEHENNADIKRGYLALEISNRTLTPFHMPSERHFLSMPEFYQKIDGVLVTSIEESCALPLMEAACAGRLPISTKVGVARDYQKVGYPGVVLPMDDREYIKEAMWLFAELKNNPKLYQRKCRDAQDFAKEYFDWEVRVHDWIKLFTE